MARCLSEDGIFFSTPAFDESFSQNAAHDKLVFVFNAEMACIWPHEIETSLQTRCSSYGKTLFQWMHCRHASAIKVHQPSSCCHVVHSLLSNSHTLQIIFKRGIGTEPFIFILRHNHLNKYIHQEVCWE
jgi:hypothetical protein